jgi:multidrug transporter EmrE-like cation transporter
VGTAVFGIVLFSEPVNLVRLLGIALVLAGIAALRLA